MDFDLRFWKIFSYQDGDDKRKKGNIIKEDRTMRRAETQTHTRDEPSHGFRTSSAVPWHLQYCEEGKGIKIRIKSPYFPKGAEYACEHYNIQSNHREI